LTIPLRLISTLIPISLTGEGFSLSNPIIAPLGEEEVVVGGGATTLVLVWKEIIALSSSANLTK